MGKKLTVAHLSPPPENDPLRSFHKHAARAGGEDRPLICRQPAIVEILFLKQKLNFKPLVINKH
jgi:hypothetical protein